MGKLSKVFIGIVFIAMYSCGSESPQKSELSSEQVSVNADSTTSDLSTNDTLNGNNTTPGVPTPVTSTSKKSNNTTAKTGALSRAQLDSIENEEFRKKELIRRAKLRGETLSEEDLAGAKFEKKVVANTSPKPKKTSPKKTPKPKVEPKTKPVVTTQKQAGKPGIVFEKREIPFDTITEGDKLDFQFKFTNTGNAPLEITNAKATCGCTRPSFPFLPIEPGESGFIGVSYDSRTKLGEQIPEIEVFSNAAEYPTKLFLVGFVKEKAE